LREIGAVRTALELLRSGYADGEKELPATERLTIAAQLAVLMGDDGHNSRAFEALRGLVPLADSLPDGNAEKFLFWKTWANSLIDAFARDLAIAALNRAITLAPSEHEKETLAVQLAEIQFLLGNVEGALVASSVSAS
jgi:hypothetical protein